MKRILFLIMTALGIACAGLQSAAAAPLEAASAAANSTPGVQMAQAISTITGVAISPLLGAGTVGAWKYYAAKTPAARASLPWYAQPWFWAPALAIVFLCALKDTFGMTVPAILKKPFDVLETVQHKVSALILVGAFVPLVASVFTSVGAAPLPGLNVACTGHGFLAVINPSWLYNGIAIAMLMGAFIVVFLASNAINILILLSPFPMVDAALKLFRLLVLATVLGTALLNPWFGALWSLMLICIAYFIAGWSLRLTHFGMIFIWDICSRRAGRFTPDKTANRMFLGRKISGVPIRTYGTFLRDVQGAFIFKYRPWLILPMRTLMLPTGFYTVGKGLFTSEIACADAGESRIVMLLPPRYRSHEAELAAIYDLTGVREAGLRAAFVWLKERLGFKPKPILIPV